MKETVLITGASGSLAKMTSQILSTDYKIRYLTTKKKIINNTSHFYWDIEKNYINIDALKNCKYIIHLAGYPILKKWSTKNKNIIYNSRIKSTNMILNACKLIHNQPKIFICASAIGIYAQSNKNSIKENDLKGNDWIAQMVSDWENSANEFKALGSRVIKMRIPLIFSEKSGFLRYNLLSMKFGIGLILGDIKRKVNWIHIHDLARFIVESIKNKKYEGAYNLVCDDQLSQQELIQAIRKKLFPYSIIIKIPNRLAKSFLGKRFRIINTDLSLSNKKLKLNGFKCNFNRFSKLLESLEKK